VIGRSSMLILASTNRTRHDLKDFRFYIKPVATWLPVEGLEPGDGHGGYAARSGGRTP